MDGDDYQAGADSTWLDARLFLKAAFRRWQILWRFGHRALGKCTGFVAEA